MNESTTLYSSEGSVDLVHHLSFKARDGGYVVNFAHGRRGTKLRTETATPTPVCYNRAREVYSTLVTKKAAQGFLMESKSYPEERSHPTDRGGSLRPIRPIDIDMGQAGRLLADSDWWLQEMFRGQHLLIRKTNEGVEGIDEAGSVIPLPEAVARAAEDIRFQWVMEGICVGDRFIVFDLPQFEMLGFRSLAYSVRMTALQDLLKRSDCHLSIAETAAGITAKVQLLQRLKIEGKTGIVLKKLNGVSRRGRFAVDGYLLQCPFNGTPLPGRFDRPSRSPSRRAGM